MADPMRIRTLTKGDITEIRVLMNHPMETGFRKDAEGKVIPAHFIQTISVDVGGRRVIQGQTGTAISRNPAFGFKVKGAKVGDEVVVNWVDNLGDKRTDKATVGA